MFYAKAFLLSVCVIVLIPISSKIEGWRGIIPLRSTRVDVERLLGPSADECKCLYRTDDEDITIIYSTGEPCNQTNPMAWRVPLDTVIDVIVHPRKDVRFSTLNIDETKYQKRAGHVPGELTYSNDDEGFVITVGQSRVIAYIYQPTAEDQRHRCMGKDMKDVSPRLVMPCVGLLSPFDPSGSYYLENKQMGGAFHYFVLKVSQIGNGLSASGFVRAVDGTHYKFTAAEVTKSSLVFKTENVRSLEFEFEGKWLYNAVFAKSNVHYEVTVLSGKLKQLVNNRIENESDIKLIYFPEC